MKVDFHYKSGQEGPIEALLRVIPSLLSMGWDIRIKKDQPIKQEKGKLVLSQQFFLDDKSMCGPSPVVLFERVDAAICWARKEVKHPNVKRVVKVGVLDPPRLQNHCWGRYHSSLIDPKLFRSCRVTFTEDELKKIVPGPGYGAYNLMKWWIGNPPSMIDKRPIILNFAGTVTYGERKEIDFHRRGAIKAMERIPGNHFIRGGRPVPRGEYNVNLTKSKICVSPWGFGELAYRDYEAMYAGAVLVKPDSSFVKTWPNILINGVTYIPCKSDWSDLPKVVAWILDSWDDLAGMRVRNREVLVEHWNSDRIAKHYSKIFEEACQ